MFWTRLLSGVVLVILALLLIIPGGIVLLISTCVISLIGLFEYYRALDLQKKPAAWAGYLFTAVYYLNLYFSRNALFSMPKKAVSLYIWKGVPFEMLIVIMLIALLFFYVLSYPKYDIKQITELFFGPVYVSVMLSYIYQARMYTHGKYLVWLIFLTAWGCDTCAYCAGRLFGKHKMSPVLSPKKTVEGAIGGVAGAFLLNLIYMMIFMKEDGIHVGNCSFQKLNSDSIEIGMDIDKRFQNQGIGTATLILLAEYLRENAPGKRHTIRTKSNNIPCQRMIVKAGGVKVDEGKTSFDSTMEGLIHSLEAHGLPEEAEKSKTVLDSAKGVCAFIYKNAR